MVHSQFDKIMNFKKLFLCIAIGSTVIGSQSQALEIIVPVKPVQTEAIFMVDDKVVGITPHYEKADIKDVGRYLPHSIAGYGERIPFDMAVELTVPDEWTITFSEKLNQIDYRVSWKGDRLWTDILDELLSQHPLSPSAVINWETRHVSVNASQSTIQRLNGN